MQVLGYDAGDGTWGAYGTAGYWYAAGAHTALLPTGITAISGPFYSPYALGDSGDPRRMAYPGGAGTMELTYDASSGSGRLITVTTSGPVDFLLSVRYCAVAAGRTAVISIWSPDGSTQYATGTTTPDLYLGVWARLRITGSCQIRAVGTYPRYQGLLIDPALSEPGRLLCIEPGVSGLLF